MSHSARKTGTSRLAQTGLAMALTITLGGCMLIGPEGAGSKSGGEVTLCHKGKKTMTLPAEAASAHLNHGDRRGPC